jgi:hypothetical protein
MAQNLPASSAGEVSALQGRVMLTRGVQSLPVTHGLAVQVGDHFERGDDRRRLAGRRRGRRRLRQS